MKILGIETSSKNLSVAVLDEEAVLAEFNGDGRLRHSQDLIPQIARLLDSANLKLEDLDGFAVSIGPGSFTGLRIGVATVKGLNFAAPKPIAPIPTMDAMAANIKEDNKDICVIIDAKRARMYGCLYAKKNGLIERQSGYLLTTIEELLEKISSPAVFLGDGIGLYKDEILKRAGSAEFAEESLWLPKARVVAGLGMVKLRKHDVISADELVPMYLYSRECSIRGLV